MLELTRRSFLFSVAPVLLPAESAPPRPRRSESFFGVHLDLHPNPSDPALGRDVSDEMVEDFLTKVKPDFVQYDCKGHVGYLGYPSKVGTSAPHIVNDSLAVWRRVTARHGVALYIHFSGVWDSRAVADHPDWARRKPDGAADSNETSTFGAYADRLMIPELEEAISRYDLDGAWIDGECWATHLDYCDAAVRGFREATGLAAPKDSAQPGWQQWKEFNRAQFRRYVRKYLDAIHNYRPQFQIASNWAYTTFMPERPELPVDYLSGDFLGNASIAAARLDARYLAQTGKTWDLRRSGYRPQARRSDRAGSGGRARTGRRVSGLPCANARRKDRSATHRGDGLGRGVLPCPKAMVPRYGDRPSSRRAVLKTQLVQRARTSPVRRVGRGRQSRVGHARCACRESHSG
jgi:hypothetical protein